mmetsp:Transcript_6022/g.8783  ORF Transcript_6022/g.8783 Transcript_6022/m.8783 type:complete len:109 (+) Transcript_6022:126-452(+)
MITSDDKNFCFVRLKGKRIISERSGSKRKISSIDAGTYKAKKIDSFSNPDAFIEHPNGPIRQYYHSRTMEPLEEGDWLVDSDDDEEADEWQNKLSEQVSTMNHVTSIA